MDGSMILGPTAPSEGSRIDVEFEATAERYPGRTALSYDGTAVSYEELRRSAEGLATRLRELGVGRGTIVGVLIDRRIEFLVALLAILKAGAAYAPLELSDPPGRIRQILDGLKPGLVISGPAGWTGVFDAEPQVVTVQDMEWCIHRPAAIGAGERSSNPPDADSACLMSTSGSSGEPKYVVVPHRAVLNLARNKTFEFVTQDDVFLFHSPTSFDASTFEIWACLLKGGELVILGKQWSTLREIAHAVESRRITTLWLPAALFEGMVDFELGSLRHVRTLITGGDVVSPRHMQKAFSALPGVRLMNGYGPTECTTFTCCFVMSSEYASAASVPIGRPISNAAVCILDERNRPVRPGAEGELHVGGAGLADGYFNQPGMTDAAFVEMDFEGGHVGRLYKTGDIVRQLPDGNIDFRGRRDNQVKLRGYRIELEEIEKHINSYPQIGKSAVHVESNPGGDKCLVATVVARGGRKPAKKRSTDEDRSAFHDHYVSSWRSVYDAKIYKNLFQNRNMYSDDLNLTGWVDSYSDSPISLNEMEIQIEETVRRILCHKPRRILEIGCGAGLLTHHLIRQCEEYVGTDISRSAIEFVKGSLDALDPSPRARVEIEECPAHRVAGLGRGRFDCIVLNSVVQHFPDIEYLLGVLGQCVEVARPGGMILVGDVRCFPLLRAFHASVQLARAPPAMPCRHLRELVDLKIAREQELLVNPVFFTSTLLDDVGVAASSIHLKRGRRQNELNRFRYDAVLHLRSAPSHPGDIASRDWPEESLSLPDVARLMGSAADKPVVVRNMPNARTVRELAAIRILDSGGGPRTVGELRALVDREAGASGIDPEDIWSLGEQSNVPVCIQWPASGRPDCFDAHLNVAVEDSPRAVGGRRSAPSVGDRPAETPAFGNRPGLRSWHDSLENGLKAYLRDRLPAHMVPSRFVWRGALPVDRRGKIDRTALGFATARAPQESLSRAAVERLVSDIWTEELEEEMPDWEANFFELGGNSLSAIRVAAKLGKSLGVYLPAHTMFENMTIRQLASEILSRVDRSDHRKSAV
jgi:amino acid adenylation domain-containing protein